MLGSSYQRQSILVENTIPADWVSVSDYRRVVKQQLPKGILAYLMADNLSADLDVDNECQEWLQHHFSWQPRVLNPHVPELTCHLYNPNASVAIDLKLPHPLLLSPVAHQKLFHPDGEKATQAATQVTQATSIWSCLGNTPFGQLFSQENIANAIQWYWQVDYQHADGIADRLHQRQYNLRLLGAFVAQGANLLVLTVDSPHAGVRHNIRRHSLTLPSVCQTVNVPESTNRHAIDLQNLMQTAPNWEDLAWLVERLTIPVILKGILHPEDAQKAQAIGCAGIMVSNHGHRVLSNAVSVAKVLPSIRKAVPEMVVLADGNVQTGSDVAMLLALGADAVGIGRPCIYGLSLKGALGVAHIIRMLLEELQVTMATLGADNLDALASFIFKPIIKTTN